MAAEATEEFCSPWRNAESETEIFFYSLGKAQTESNQKLAETSNLPPLPQTKVEFPRL